jgi:hypothetical protein
MADAIIPANILRVLPVLRHSFGIDHHYSDDIADSADSDLAAMLRLNGRLYAVWSPRANPDPRIVQSAERTQWSDLYPEDLEEEVVKLVDVEVTGDEVRRVLVSDMPLALVLRELLGRDDPD